HRTGKPHTNGINPATNRGMLRPSGAPSSDKPPPKHSSPIAGKAVRLARSPMMGKRIHERAVALLPRQIQIANTSNATPISAIATPDQSTVGYFQKASFLAPSLIQPPTFSTPSPILSPILPPRSTK